jgi:hypothetical protein
MTRRALLIEASRIKNLADLPGAREDVASYRDFLKSDFGGAWEDPEIHVLSNPSKKLLTEWLELAGKADYSFVTFSGHGEHVVGKKINETRVCINDTEEFPVYSLNTGSPRCLVVADACRKVTRVSMEKSARSIMASLMEAEEALRPNRQRCRRLFDLTLTQSERGAIFMYSCDLDEAASDTDSFSRFLVAVGEGWAERRSAGVLLADGAFKVAAKETTARNKQQHPQMDAGRRIAYFPFAVLAY